MRPLYPKFKNDNGLKEIRIGAKQFQCAGVSAPHDHPHVYLDMGDDDAIPCPYCNTVYRHDPTMGAWESDPADCVFEGA